MEKSYAKMKNDEDKKNPVKLNYLYVMLEKSFTLNGRKSKNPTKKKKKNVNLMLK